MTKPNKVTDNNKNYSFERFDQEAYNNFCIKMGAVGFFPEGKRLASGIISAWYFNGRRLADYVRDEEKTATFFLDYLDEIGIKPDYFIGVPDGATKVTMTLNKRLGMDTKDMQVRKDVKEYGDKADKYFIGPAEKGDIAVLIEDATTTGTSLITHLNKCREHGLIIPATMCECNRLEKARDKNGKELDYGVEDAVRIITGGKTSHHSLTTAKDILPLAYEILDPGKEIAKAIEKEYKEHGIVDIKLI